jgi:small subunit ribosomal protein S3
MSHSVHPFAHRLGLLRDWQSRWFAKKADFPALLRVDVLLREYLTKRLRGMYVGAIEIERGSNLLRLIIRTSRPGMVIGRSGEGSAKLKDDVLKFLRGLGAPMPKSFRLDIEEIRNPEANARLSAQMVVEGLEKRLPFKKTMRQTIDKIMANRQVEGVKITLSGRLGGAEIGRTESLKQGRLPLQTLRADVDFAREEALLPYGVIGVKVWIYRGQIFNDNTSSKKS